MNDFDFEELKKEVEELEEFINEFIGEKRVHYRITRPVRTEDGVFLRLDTINVSEEQLPNTIAELTSEPWFSKLSIEKVNK